MKKIIFRRISTKNISLSIVEDLVTEGVVTYSSNDIVKLE